ncbi:MAG TPA: polysaccharide biosynthesis/export family protein [Gemmatimonadaceae bacterium]|nr:polysaccharide biosynthesis/export family protein [Gemmatimonadaceae bacterium]
MLRPITLLLASLALFGGADLNAQSDSLATTLRPGDQVRIVVWRNPELSGDFAVSGNGTITHPLYREIQVVGVPLPTVEERLRTFLTRYVANPQFVFFPLVKIAVGGQVRSPNVLSVPPETTIAQAIVLAGGPTETGNLADVHVIRERQDVRLDLTKIDSDVALLQIRSNDQILVGKRRNVFRDVISPVIGAVGAAAAVTSLILR